jgi:2-furoyl-CoA dehydrogenase FAD binding subunit
MKPASFDYLRPETPEEALEALRQHGDEARILAGGQSLMVLLNMRLARPSLLVDIARLEALARCRSEDGALVVGAAVTQAALEERPSLKDEAPLVAQALPLLGHYQTRNRGTVCGSIAHADPSAELPLCLLALEGEVVLRSHGARRTVPAEQFFLGFLSTARRDDEMIEAVRFPLPRAGVGSAFREVAQRHGDFALVACAALVRAEGIRFAVGGVASQPVALDWPALDGTALDDALSEFAWALEASDDAHASARYRRELVRRLGRVVIEEARACRP